MRASCPSHLRRLHPIFTSDGRLVAHLVTRVSYAVILSFSHTMCVHIETSSSSSRLQAAGCASVKQVMPHNQTVKWTARLLEKSSLATKCVC